MLEEFKKFAMRGNVVDLAVAVIIGAAFGAIINSLVADVIMPIIGTVSGGLDFSNYFLSLSSKVTAPSLSQAPGSRVQCSPGATSSLSSSTFVIIALSLFLVVKGISRLKGPRAPPAPPAPSDGSAVADGDSRRTEKLRCRRDSGMAAKAERKLRVVADNRKARFNYFIDETMEAGSALTGTEVKSLHVAARRRSRSRTPTPAAARFG